MDVSGLDSEELQEQQLPVKLPDELEEFQDAVEATEALEQSSDATRSELWKARKARSQARAPGA